MTEDVTVIGLGTGSTAFWAIERVGQLVKDGRYLRAVPTSQTTKDLCLAHNVNVVDDPALEPIAVAIDGADEVAPDFCLTKGGGGALFREKIVATASALFVVVVGENKLVERLGKFKTPVEVVPFATNFVRKRIKGLLCPDVQLRTIGGSSAFVTDNGNHILDCSFGSIENPAETDAALRRIEGVVMTGLFVDPDLRKRTRVLVGKADGSVTELSRV